MARLARLSGYSIIEIMVAMVIFGFVVATAVTIVNQNQRIHAALNEEYAFFHEIRATMTLLENDISMIFILPPRFDYQHEVEIFDAVFVGEPTQISAVTRNYFKRVARTRDTNVREIVYSLVPDDGADKTEPAFILTKRMSSFLDAELFVGGTEYDVLTDLKSLSFSYYDERHKRWEERWDSRSGDTKNLIPKAVAVEFEIYYRDPERPLDPPFVYAFETKFLADAVIERERLFELSRDVRRVKHLIDMHKKRMEATQ